MRGGRLRNEGKIQSNAPTRDAIGGEVAAWSDFVASWWFELLEVGKKTGTEFLVKGHVVHAQANYVAMGRSVSGVTAKMRLTLGSRTFDIIRAFDPDGRGRELRLDLLERNI